MEDFITGIEDNTIEHRRSIREEIFLAFKARSRLSRIPCPIGARVKWREMEEEEEEVGGRL